MRPHSPLPHAATAALLCLLACASGCTTDAEPSEEMDAPAVLGAGGSSGAAEAEVEVEDAAVPTPEPTCEGEPAGTEERRERFAAATVAFGGACEAERQTRSCVDGDWTDWSGSATHADCSEEPPADCEEVAHGEPDSRERFAAAEVPYGAACEAETQTAACDNGVLGAWSGSFTEPSCTVAAPADCDGGLHGETQMRDRYGAALVPYGETCDVETQSRACEDGSWSEWGGDYDVEVCEVDTYTAGSCTNYFNGEPQVCQEFVGLGFDVPTAEDACENLYVEDYQSGHCSEQGGLIGVCRYDWDGGEERTAAQFYYEDAYDLAKAKLACQALGSLDFVEVVPEEE